MRAITGQRHIEAAPSTELRESPRLVAVQPKSGRSTIEKLFLAIMVASLSIFAVAFATQVLDPAVQVATSSAPADANTVGW